MQPESVKLKEANAHSKHPLTIVLLSLLGVSIICYALYSYQLMYPLLFGYEEQSPWLSAFSSYFALILLIPFLLLLVSWFIARRFYRSQSKGLWVLLLVGVHTVLWHGLFFTLTPLVTRLVNPPDWAAYAVGLGLQVAAVFLIASFVASLVAAVMLALLGWRQKTATVKTGVLASYLFGMLAIVVLVYVSGAMKYPAQLLDIKPLCYLVLSPLERSACLVSSFEPAEESPFESIKLTDFSPHSFQMIDGRLVFKAKPSRTGPDRYEQIYIDGVAYTDQTINPVAGEIVGVGDGRIAYVGFTGTDEDYRMTLYINNEPFLTKKTIALFNTPGELTYAVYDDSGSYLSQNGKIIVEGREATIEYATKQMPRKSREDYDRVIDEKTGTYTFTIGNYTLMQKGLDLYVNDKLFAPGLQVFEMKLLDGKVLFLASGKSGEDTFDQYLFFEKGLLTDEVIARIEAL